MRRLLRMPPRGVYVELLGDMSRIVPKDKTSVEILRKCFARLSTSDLFDKSKS